MKSINGNIEVFNHIVSKSIKNVLTIRFKKIHRTNSDTFTSTSGVQTSELLKPVEGPHDDSCLPVKINFGL